MERPKRRWTDNDVEQIIGTLLRIGVLTAATLVAIGAVLYVYHNGRAAPPFGTFTGEPAALRNVGTVLANVFSGSGRDVIQLGILVLIATPVARVIFTVFAFAVERDRTYVIITLIVLAVLVYSLLWGTL